MKLTRKKSVTASRRKPAATPPSRPFIIQAQRNDSRYPAGWTDLASDVDRSRPMEFATHEEGRLVLEKLTSKPGVLYYRLVHVVACSKPV